MDVILISTYELGRQPFGLASPAAWLKEEGARVTCFDLAVEQLDEKVVAAAGFIGFHVPMHTATRLATRQFKRIKEINPDAHFCFYGLYAPVNEEFLRKLGAHTILGGEFEEGLVSAYRRVAVQRNQTDDQLEPRISYGRQNFRLPDRSVLPVLDRYARLVVELNNERVVGYTEATRGCKHLCRHCPVVPVYQGRFRVIQRDVVMGDIAQQVAAGATHITFGDPDFFNGPGHAVKIVEALHQRFPAVSYDVTIKVEHLLKHAGLLSVLHDTGCLFVTCAVEAVDNRILEIFDKGHTREDFIEVVELSRAVGINLNPTFVTFSPWITLKGYLDLLELILELDLVGNIAPIQYAIRLLIPRGSRLLELPEVRQIVGDFDEEGLCYRWAHPDPRVDQLCAEVLATVQDCQAKGLSRSAIFHRVWRQAREAYDTTVVETLEREALEPLQDRVKVPYLTEPWYC